MEKSEKKIFLELIEKGELELKDLSSELRNDLEFVKEVLKFDKTAFGSVSENLRANKDLVMYALECKCMNILHYASEELLNDKDVVLLAVKINYSAGLTRVSKTLQADFEILIESAIRSGTSDISELNRIETILNH